MEAKAVAMDRPEELVGMSLHCNPSDAPPANFAGVKSPKRHKYTRRDSVALLAVWHTTIGKRSGGRHAHTRAWLKAAAERLRESPAWIACREEY